MPDTRARCCWCDGLLAIDVQGFWWCRQPACQQKQAIWARGIAVKGQTQPKWYYVPTPKQAVWHEAVYDRSLTRILVGGQAGPGKSRFLREAAYRLCKQIAGLHVLLLRRTYKDLDQSHLRFMPFEAKTCGGEFKATDRIAVFAHKDAADSVIRCGHLEDAGSIQNFLSAEYDLIMPDELVTFEQDAMIELFTRARSSNQKLREVRGHAVEKLDGSLVLAASNPGGRGALWVKDFFIDHSPDPTKFPKYRAQRWAFFEARLQDNPYIEQGYREALEDLPEIRRRQLLEGDWDAWEGQMFPEWRDALHVREVLMHAA